jgi:hypothetical protein
MIQTTEPDWALAGAEASIARCDRGVGYGRGVASYVGDPRASSRSALADYGRLRRLRDE